MEESSMELRQFSLYNQKAKSFGPFKTCLYTDTAFLKRK